MSPIFFILITLLLTSIIWSVIFLMAWFTLGKKSYALFWAGAFILSACQWGTILLRSHFDSDTLYWMTGVSLSMGSVILGTWGHAIRARSPINLRYLLALAVITLASVYYYKAVDVHIGLSMSLYIYYDILLLLINAVIIIKHKAKSLPAEIGAAITYTVCGVCLFIAATIALMQGSQVNQAYLDLYTLINFITVPTAHVGMAVFIIFIMASDLAQEMQKLAMTDVLTQCINRRGFYDIGQQKIESQLGCKQHVSLIYWDIDSFKNINDDYGHAAGDEVLVQATQRIKMCLQKDDIFARLGGEEFVILIARDSELKAKQFADKLRETLASKPIEYEKQCINVTASFGVISIKSVNTPIDKAIDLADKALYIAKHEGKNKVAYAMPLN
ncbi:MULTISPECIES: GGDEF domain-containing protein [Pseudoalteromonas]|uniref:GGDEF domain-containing protein n=1 Tax=Pseudoalteromonas undina TaxID=43660 RepID=A0ACC6QZ05_9GAMM|nr:MULTISPECIES: GGDEF domain-containing protein [unclassified Pseudoalteromonas]KPZ58372.1 putative diguanylate cyclase YdaM [Pseudoalteromonas sp. P1-25]KPZ60541.1 putative diguanylate cyclase YdaM [Pseudoalteromonas sp. P1-13-1a]KPZ62917.1 putative diguanylate cyclase YdaM [Pseudoalteromonas sp. P1-7a]